MLLQFLHIFAPDTSYRRDANFEDLPPNFLVSNVLTVNGVSAKLCGGVSFNTKNSQMTHREQKKENLKPAIFNYDSDQQLSTLTVNNEPWFIAKEVCSILSITRTGVAMRKLDEDEKLMRKVYASGQTRTLWMVNESGLYHLIFRSNKPQAKAFRKWVTNTVLPTLRTQGSYSLSGQQASQQPLPQQVARCIQLCGSLRRMATRTGLGKSTLSLVVNGKTQALSPTMYKKVQVACKNLLQQGTLPQVDVATIDMLMAIEPSKTRQALYTKLKNAQQLW